MMTHVSLPDVNIYVLKVVIEFLSTGKHNITLTVFNMPDLLCKTYLSTVFLLFRYSQMLRGSRKRGQKSSRQSLRDPAKTFTFPGDLT